LLWPVLKKPVPERYQNKEQICCHGRITDRTAYHLS